MYKLSKIIILMLCVTHSSNAQVSDPNLKQTLNEANIINNIKKNVQPVSIKDEETVANSDHLNNQTNVELPTTKAVQTPIVKEKMKSSVSSGIFAENSSDLAAKAFKASQLGQLEAASILYGEALRLDPKNTNILFAMGAIYQRLGQNDEARVIYSKLFKLDPKHEMGINNFLALIGEESPSKALGHLQEIDKINPNFSPVKAQIGMIYANLGQFDLAEQYLRRAIQLSPEIVSYYYNLGVLYDKMLNYPAAIHMYKQVLEFAGNEMSSLNNEELSKRIRFLQKKIM